MGLGHRDFGLGLLVVINLGHVEIKALFAHIMHFAQKTHVLLIFFASRNVFPLLLKGLVQHSSFQGPLLTRLKF